MVIYAFTLLKQICFPDAKSNAAYKGRDNTSYFKHEAPLIHILEKKTDFNTFFAFRMILNDDVLKVEFECKYYKISVQTKWLYPIVSIHVCSDLIGCIYKGNSNI